MRQAGARCQSPKAEKTTRADAPPTSWAWPTRRQSSPAGWRRSGRRERALRLKKAGGLEGLPYLVVEGQG